VPRGRQVDGGEAAAEITGLPLIHLDRHYWQPGWTRPDPESWQETVRELAAGPRWIIDGNYGSTLNLRLTAADTLIHLDFSTFVCALRVLRRTLTGLGGQRGGELGDGCLERLDWPFFQFVLNYRRTHRNRDLELMSGFGGTLYRVESPGQLESLFRLLENRRSPAAEI
jgi:adenylate kinase family enzyme